MKRIYCLALVMSLVVGCESNDASEGTPEAGVTGGAPEAGVTGGAPEAGVTGGVEIEGCAQSDSCIESGLYIKNIDASRCVATDESCQG